MFYSKTLSLTIALRSAMLKKKIFLKEEHFMAASKKKRTGARAAVVVVLCLVLVCVVAAAVALGLVSRRVKSFSGGASFSLDYQITSTAA